MDKNSIDQKIDNFTEAMRRLHNKSLFEFLDEFLRGELKLLFTLLAMDEPFISPSELSERVRMTKARITAAVTAMEKKGLVTRAMDKDDRRKINIAITEKGEAAAMEKYEEFAESVKYLFSKMEEEEVDCYIRLMNKIADILD